MSNNAFLRPLVWLEMKTQQDATVATTSNVNELKYLKLQLFLYKDVEQPDITSSNFSVWKQIITIT